MVVEYLAKWDAMLCLAENLPLSVRAFVVRTADCSYCIVINAALSESAKRRAVQHELRHIERGDLFSDSPVSELERWD